MLLEIQSDDILSNIFAVELNEKITQLLETCGLCIYYLELTGNQMTINFKTMVCVVKAYITLS